LRRLALALLCCYSTCDGRYGRLISHSRIHASAPDYLQLVKEKELLAIEKQSWIREKEALLKDREMWVKNKENATAQAQKLNDGMLSVLC
jgi:hypothetical protein